MLSKALTLMTEIVRVSSLTVLEINRISNCRENTMTLENLTLTLKARLYFVKCYRRCPDLGGRIWMVTKQIPLSHFVH